MVIREEPDLSFTCTTCGQKPAGPSLTWGADQPAAWSDVPRDERTRVQPSSDQCKNLERMSELWDSPGRESGPSYFGWLSTMIPAYPETLNFKAQVHAREVGVPPPLGLEETDHLRSIEQHRGISEERIRQTAEALMH